MAAPATASVPPRSNQAPRPKRHCGASVAAALGSGDGIGPVDVSGDARPLALGEPLETADAEADEPGAPPDAVGPTLGRAGGGDTPLPGVGVVRGGGAAGVGVAVPGVAGGGVGDGATVAGGVGAGVGRGVADGVAVGDGDATGETSTCPASNAASPFVTVATNVTVHEPAGNVVAPA